MRTDNKTVYGIVDKAERYMWISWNITVILASLIGDPLILIGTIKYQAIKLHKVLVAVIQHMAVCDIIQTVFRVLPAIVSLIADRWTLGEVVCHVQESVVYVCGGLTVSLTCTLSLLKLLILKYPLRARTWTSHTSHLVCTIMWLIDLLFYTPVLFVFYKRDLIYFSYRGYNCNYDISNVPLWLGWYWRIGTLLAPTILYFILVVSSLLLLVVARKIAARQGGRLKWMGVFTVLLTVGVLMISCLPNVLMIVLRDGLGVKYSSTTWHTIVHLQYLNIMGNFFVYSLTVRSFRRFLKLKISLLLSSLLSFLGASSQIPGPPGIPAPRQVPTRDTDPPQQQGSSQNHIAVLVSSREDLKKKDHEVSLALAAELQEIQMKEEKTAQ